jgi:hypothetical protein
MSFTDERNELLDDYRRDLGPMPARPPLGTKVIYKRGMRGYEEWKIEYTAESPDTMPEPAAQKIAAYLLIPRMQGKAAKSWFPAMICFHECFCDCTTGKDAVVGKAFDRPDQA